MLPLRDQLPTRSTPVVTISLITLNIAAFVWEWLTIASGMPAARFLREWGLIPARFTEAPVQDLVTVFSSMFLHDPSGLPLHLAGNMLFLWIFGDNVEDALGRLNFAVFYILSGCAAAFAQIAIDPSSQIPMIGASGAVSGVLAAYGSLYPRSPITVLNPFLPLWLFFGPTLMLPAWLVIAEYFIVNLLNGLGSVGGTGGGVAFFAHLGGFVAGLILCRFFRMGRPPRDHDRWSTFRPPPRRPPYPGHPRPGASPPRRGPWDW
ncbi:MAG: rhomboid family intramembrane serine protease [Polyangiaceae bacterium]|nr:rhomboid family intramembrane serine protease [Polyangiaceae bacterium]NUQ79516.1 rhomboid family intramembrane serine protease [Polyangiaceae bacterium]